MSNPYPPARRLTRSATDRKVTGVCGGLAEYLNADATLIRLAVVTLTVFTGGAALALYILAVLVIPEDTRNRPPSNRMYPPIYPPSAVPGPRPAPPTVGDPIWGREGAPWEQPQNAPRPGRSADPDAPTDLR